MSDKLIESTERMFDSFERLVMRGVEMETEIADLKRQLAEAQADAAEFRRLKEMGREMKQQVEALKTAPMWMGIRDAMREQELSQARAAAFAEVIEWCEENGHRFMQPTAKNDKSILVSQIRERFGEKA